MQRKQRLLIWLILVSFVGVSYGSLQNCREPDARIPDISVRCDKDAECALCERNHHSFDFLCCEDGNGWVAAHLTNPLLFYMFFQNVEWTIIVILVFEIFEALFLYGNWFMFNVPENEVETLTGALLGDGLLQGGSGLLFGVLLTYAFDFPILVSTQLRAYRETQLARTRNSTSNRGMWMRILYISVWIGHSLLYILPSWINEGDTIRYGLYVNTGLQLVLLWGIYPFLLYASDTAKRMVWSKSNNPDASVKELESRQYSRTKQITVFVVWGVIVLALHMSTFGWHYFANDWFQVWLTQVIILALLFIAALCRAIREKNWYKTVVFVITLLLYTTVALLVFSVLWENSTLQYTMSAILVLCLILYGVNEIVFIHRPVEENWSRRKTINGRNENQPLMTDDYDRIPLNAMPRTLRLRKTLK